MEVRTTLELRTGERFLRVRVDYTNTARDHRLRAHFPLPAIVTGSDAECAFAVVRRGLDAEGGPHEYGLPTFVSRRFVDCSDGDLGVALLHDGLLEYEVVDGGRELALTLLRATGYLSRAEPALPTEPGGPARPARGPAAPAPTARRVRRTPPPRRLARGAARRSSRRVPRAPRAHARRRDHASAAAQQSGAALTVDGARVTAVLREHTGAPLTLRLCNPAAEPATATIALDGRPAQLEVVDLAGRAIESRTGSIDLRPWEIVTVRAA